MKKLYVLFASFFIINTYSSQEYRSAIGIKTGYPGIIGLNFKIPLTDKRKIALDNILGTNFDFENQFVAVQSLFEINNRIGINSDYFWYYGAGPTLQVYTNGGYLPKDSLSGQEIGGTHVKIDFCIGLERSHDNSPFNFAVEAGPALFVTPIIRPDFQINISLRYAFRGR